jgi:hypothetical protein
VVDDPPLDDDVGLGEPRFEIAAAERPLADLVRAKPLVDERRGGLERCLRVGDHRERVVLDDHALGRVDHGVAVITDDEGHRVADVLDLALGQDPVVGRVDLDAGRDPRHRQAGVHVEVVVGEDVEALGHARGVDRDDLRVGLG